MSVLITVVGVPEDGCPSLSSRAVNAVVSARVVAGHPRHLDWFPQFSGRFLDMTQGFASWLSQLIDESEEGEVVVLASGDPLFFGIGSTLLKQLRADQLRFIPSMSSAQLAFARLGLPWQGAGFLSCHGRVLKGLVSQMQQGDLFAILTDAENSPQRLAQHLLQFNQNEWRLTVCEQLGGVNERIRAFSVAELAQVDGADGVDGANRADGENAAFAPLNLVVAERVANPSQPRWGGHGQFAPDASFAKRMPKQGLITKQPIRNLVLTSLRLRPDATVWDIGAGSGSVAIEAAKRCWRGNVYAIECHQGCAEAIAANLVAHGTDNVELVVAKAPDGLAVLPYPDAVFIGGSRGNMAEILSMVWPRLHAGGQLMVSAVTLDTVAEVYQWAKAQGVALECQVVNIAQTQPLAHYQRYQAENPIHLFLMTQLTPHLTPLVSEPIR
jgi:precorrin-6Y C5,15-methyltransferase (decarboxylating)